MVDIRRNKLEEGTIIPLWFDYVFCGIFNDEKNISILENLVSTFLEIPIEDIKGNIKIKQRELPISKKTESNKQIDLLLEYKGNKINIEMNSSSSKGIIDRNVVYISKIHGEQKEYGRKNYKEINKSHQLNFNKGYKNEKKIVERYYLRNEEGKILTEKLELDMIDLSIGSKIFEEEKENKQARWCRIILTKDKSEFEKLIKDDEFMDNKNQEELNKEIEKYSNDEEVIALYTELSRGELERNTFIAEAKEEGIKEGIKEGIEQEKRKMIKLLSESMTLEEISTRLKIPLDEINKILNNSNNIE